MKQFYAVSARLYNLPSLTWSAMWQPLDLLSCLDESHPRWQAISAIYERVVLDTPENIEASYAALIKKVSISYNAVVASSHE